jgi:histidinol-phosphatase (PHP family)
MTDCHVHTNYSPDGFYSPEAVVRAAIKKGIGYLAITDHLDFDPKYKNALSESNIAEYVERLSALKKKYCGQIDLAVGIEAGYTVRNAIRISDITKSYRFDYIINSVHEVNGEDCYFKGYFKGKTKYEAYNAYLETVYESLSAPYPYHAVGHLGYVERKAPYTGTDMNLREFGGAIDRILKEIIAKDKILEINTNVYLKNLSYMPNSEILSRYKDLGGKKTAFASDAHKLERLGYGYGEAADTAKRLGLELFKESP